MKMIISTIIYALIGCYGIGDSMGGSVGDSCSVARTGAPGTCRDLNQCQPVIDEIAETRLLPVRCGQRGRDHIICCPNPPTLNRISVLSKFRWLLFAVDFILFI